MFSPPPLKFRTAGFPQYGFKQELSRDLRCSVRRAERLIRGQSPARLRPVMDPAVKTSPRGEAEVEVPRGNPVQRSLARQRVIVSRRVKAYYDLIRASAILSTTYEFAVEPFNPSGRGGRGSPIYSVHLFVRAIPSTPVDRPGAIGCCFPSRISLRPLCTGSASTTHASRFTRGCVTRLIQVRLRYGPHDG